MSRHPISASGTEHVARLSLDSLGISVEMPLAPILRWWESLRERNRRAREIDEYGSPVEPYRFVRSCPACEADFSHLATYSKGDSIVRICMFCRHEIPG